MCARELPELEAAVSAREDAAVLVIAPEGDDDRVREELARSGFGGPVLVDVPVERPRGHRAESLAQRYGVDRVPWTLVVNQRGRGVDVWLGSKARDEIARALDALD